jgi:hypothetical protein
MIQHFKHQMKICKVYETGAQEWLCLDCERRILVSWTPAFKRILLDPGDDRAVHTGSFGGIELSGSGLQKDSFPTPYLGTANGPVRLH